MYKTLGNIMSPFLMRWQRRCVIRISKKTETNKIETKRKLRLSQCLLIHYLVRSASQRTILIFSRIKIRDKVLKAYPEIFKKVWAALTELRVEASILLMLLINQKLIK